MIWIRVSKDIYNFAALRSKRVLIKAPNLDLSKSINPDAYINLKDINYDLYQQLSSIGPFGIMNPKPLFWTRKCKILDIYNLKGNHLKMILSDGTSSVEAIRWNSSIQLKKSDLIDIAFFVEMNRWKNTNNLQLNIIDIKIHKKIIKLQIHKHIYNCQLNDNNDILITNVKGQCICSRLSMSSEKLNPKQTHTE